MANNSAERGEIEPFKSIVEVEYDAAISRGAASFVQLAEAHFYAQEKFNGNRTNEKCTDDIMRRWPKPSWLPTDSE